MQNQNTGVKGYFYKKDALDELITALSSERFATYLEATNGDKTQAMRLYTWNAAISAAFYLPLQALEIALRNSMHTQLSECYGAEWYDNNATGLNDKTKDNISEAKSRILQKREEPSISPPDLVANLSFGFWVSLLAPRYKQTLWRDALYKAFPHAKSLKQKKANESLHHLLSLRNKIAHHEPIFKYGQGKLQAEYEAILRVLGWLSPHKVAWVEAHSRVPELLALSPNDAFQF